MRRIYSNKILVSDEDFFKEMVLKIYPNAYFECYENLVSFVCDDVSIDDIDEDDLEILQSLLFKNCFALIRDINCSAQNLEDRCLIFDKETYRLLDFEDFILDYLRMNFENILMDMDLTQEKIYYDELKNIFNEE